MAIIGAPFRMPRFESLVWGKAVIDGKTYNYDIAILPDGRIEPRTTPYETLGSHTFTRDEIERLINAGAEVIVVGTGTSGMAKLSPEAQRLASERGVELVVQTSPLAINTYNWYAAQGRRVAALIHVTC